MTIQEAIILFDAGDYKEAFVNFAKIYNESPNAQERQDIMAMLQEAYYQPNEPELRENYEKNIESLAAYPYLWEKQFADFSSLSFLLFPVSDDCYYLYDKKADRFVGEYDGITRHQMRYFFENLDHALRVEDEDNLYNLTFLFDNVRRSEDVAMDNHIYLLYHSWEPLQRVMQVGDLTPLLLHEKFVFLMGQENFDRYPIDFKTEFGVDYSNMTPQMLRIDEMKRICYWWKRGYSGTMLGLGVLEQNTNTIVKMGWAFHKETKVQGYPLYLTKFFSDFVQDLKTQYTLESLQALYKHKEIEWHFPNFKQFFSFVQKYDKERRSYSLSDLFRLFCLYIFYGKKPNANPRIVPTIVWEPHLNDQMLYEPLVMTFTYRVVMNSMREPVTLTGRIYQSEQSIFPYSDYTLAMSMNEALRNDYYVFRFEDLKKFPCETIVAICQVLNIPFEEGMLEADVPYHSPNTSKKDEVVHGFDQAPLHRNLDSALSDFDQVRLRIFYDPILRHYGYERFNFDECPMTDQDIYFLLKFPLRCESDYIARKKENITAQQLRERLYQNMCALWNMAKDGKIVLPKVILPKIQEGNS
nr:hypothetical protein [uncultured Agathobaculum sp.]